MPPALSPPTASRLVSMPSSSALADHPVERGPGVVARRRARVLGRQAVVDRDDDDAGPGAELPAQRVVAVEVADDPPAAVVVDEAAGHALPAGAVHPDRYRAIGPGDGPVLHRSDLGLAGSGHRERLAGLTHLRGRLLGERRRLQQGERIQDDLDLRVDGHGLLRSPGAWTGRNRRR